MTENSLEQQALSQLNAKHYKEAIALYQQLWQASGNEKWQQQLAHCYIQRALSFAERGMIREALLLWENFIQYAKNPFDFYDHYIDWLIQSNDQNGVKQALQQLSAQQLDKQYPALAVSLGLLMLTKHPEYQRFLPAESTFIAHFRIAQAAWQSYQNNDLDELNKNLKKIPYRSAFKDFRLLLSTVLNFPCSVEQALTTTSVSPPYALILNLLHVCTLEGSNLLEKLAQFNYSQRCAIAEIKGLDDNQLQFIESVIQHHGDLSDKIKFNLSIQYQTLVGSELAQNFCQAILANYSSGEREFDRQFTTASRFESNRIKALVSERDGQNESAEYLWRQCIDNLSAEGVENHLKIALILRHITELQTDSSVCNQLLIESLDYDPDDLASYQSILHYFSQYTQDKEEYEYWLQKTIEKYPDNVGIVAQAIEIATRNKEYKVVNQYALKILRIDPLNMSAKEILFTNYLAEARQLIQHKKYQLVEQKITHAEDLKLGEKQGSQIQLIRGLFWLAEQDKKQGLELVIESLNKLNGDPVNILLQATMEALLTGLPVATLLDNLEPVQSHLLSKQELTRAIQQLTYYGEIFDHQHLLLKAVEKIEPALKTSLSQQDYDEQQLLALCQSLVNINAFELLRYCATLAVDKWNTPLWQYYQLYAKNNGLAERCSVEDIVYLKALRQQAVVEHANRAMALIDTFLEEYNYSQAEVGVNIIEDLLDLDKEQENFADPLEQLFAQIPEDELLKLTKKTEALTVTTTPEQLVEDLIKESDNHQHILQAMMQQPDLYSALITIKAASSLGLSISVSQTLKSFKVN